MGSDLVNIASLQLSQKLRWIHSARLDEALVTAAFYVKGCDLKSTCNFHNGTAEDASA